MYEKNGTFFIQIGPYLLFSVFRRYWYRGGYDSKRTAQTAGLCSTRPVNSTAFIKTYHLREGTDGFGVFPPKTGFLVTGDTIAGGAMAAPYPYIVKTDAKGRQEMWSKDFSSQSGALGYLSNRHFGRLAIETTDGNFVTASDVVDFVNEDLKEFYGDVCSPN